MDETEFKKRVRVSINKVACERALNNKSLAAELGMTATTISNYRTMRNLPKTSFVLRFCELYQCNKEWLLTGNGRPFMDSADEYPELYEKYWEIKAGKKLTISSNYQNGLATENILARHPLPTESSVADVNVSEDLSLAAKVLSSDTHYATALHLNIRSFSRALDSDNRIGHVETVNATIMNENNELKRQISTLKTENERMNIQLANLQAAVQKLQERNGYASEKTGEKNANVVKEKAG